MFPVVLAESSSRADHFASFDVHPWQWALFVGFIAVLIVADLLTDDELRWLNDYHTETREKLLPLIEDPEAKAWLRRATAPLS